MPFAWPTLRAAPEAIPVRGLLPATAGTGSPGGRRRRAAGRRRRAVFTRTRRACRARRRRRVTARVGAATTVCDDHRRTRVVRRLGDRAELGLPGTARRCARAAAAVAPGADPVAPFALQRPRVARRL